LIALLDVNVLVALFDSAHVHFEYAHRWFAEQRPKGWATCPLTENGFVRVIANPSYPGSRTTILDALERLAAFRASGQHSFWPDSVSLCDAGVIDPRHIQGHRQLTDVYLLSLAVDHGGQLATFDSGIGSATVTEAGPEHLVVIRP
jgi:toxin-antitoxin system PIN domain toxin